MIAGPLHFGSELVVRVQDFLELLKFSNNKYSSWTQEWIIYLVFPLTSPRAVDVLTSQPAPPLREQTSSMLSMGGRMAEFDRISTTKLQEILNEAIHPSFCGILVANKIAKVDEHVWSLLMHSWSPAHLAPNRDTTRCLIHFSSNNGSP